MRARKSIVARAILMPTAKTTRVSTATASVARRNHTDRGRKALKLSVVSDDSGVIIGACCHPGNRPDVVLLDDTIRSAFVRLEALELFADRGYDSRRNRTFCRDSGLKDRIFRRKTKTVRRTNAKRIVVEHTFAWLERHISRSEACAVATTQNAQSFTIGTTTPLSTSETDARAYSSLVEIIFRLTRPRTTRSCLG